jgi:hypothetical protein
VPARVGGRGAGAAADWRWAMVEEGGAARLRDRGAVRGWRPSRRWRWGGLSCVLFNAEDTEEEEIVSVAGRGPRALSACIHALADATCDV